MKKISILICLLFLVFLWTPEMVFASDLSDNLLEKYKIGWSQLDQWNLFQDAANDIVALETTGTMDALNIGGDAGICGNLTVSGSVVYLLESSLAISDSSGVDIWKFDNCNRFIKFTKQCIPVDEVITTDTLGMYMRLKGSNLNLMGKDDAGYEFQIGGANTYINQGCDISGSGSTGCVGTTISTALEFGRGTWFNLLNGGTFTGGFQTTNIDEKDRIIYLVANQNTILVDGLGTTNLDLGGCNLNMGAGRPHAFWFDGCKWHSIGHHNDF